MKFLQHVRPIYFVTIYLLLSLVASKNSLLAQEDYRTLPLPNIPQNEVNDILQDHKGYVWLATLDGLHRYDGYSYHSYYYKDDSNAISSNMIQRIREDSKGGIWIGTYGRGLCYLNTRTGKFTRYNTKQMVNSRLHSEDVMHMTIDKEDNIWYANWWGVFCLTPDREHPEDKTKAKLRYFTKEKLNLDENENIISIYADKKGYIWLGTNLNLLQLLDTSKEIPTYKIFSGRSDQVVEEGNYLYVSGTNTFRVNTSNYTQEILSNYGGNVLCIQNSRIWVGNDEGAILITPPNNSASKKMWKITKRFYKENISYNLKSTVATSIQVINGNQIWLGTRGGGVTCIVPPSAPFTCITASMSHGGLPNGLTRAVFEDSKQTLWVGNERKGFFSIKHKGDYNKDFKAYRYAEGSNNRVYAFEETFPKNVSKHKRIIWVGTSWPDCLVALDGDTKQRIPLNLDTPIGFVFALEKTDEHTLWAGTYRNGLYRITLDDKGGIKNYKAFRVKTQPYSISSNIIRHIYQDKHKDLWITTDRGVNRIARKELLTDNPKFEHFVDKKAGLDLANYYMLGVQEDTKLGRVYFGSMGAGLITFDRKTESWSFLTTEDGLISNAAKSIVKDNQYLWIGTNKGLVRYNRLNKEMQVFDSHRGLVDDEFSEICAIRRQDGNLVFGSRNGLVSFQGKGFEPDTLKPHLVLTDLYIDSRRVSVNDTLNGRVLLKESIEHSKKLHLKYAENNFAIGFAGISYNAPLKTSYRYKLEGFDTHWNKVSAIHRRAQYTNIREGKYILKVQVANADNMWSDQLIELPIQIDPPFSRSTTAYIIYMLLACIISWIIYKIGMTFQHEKEELLAAQLEKVNTEKLLQYKSQFFANISQEFRTPLTLISVPLDHVVEQSKLLADKHIFNELIRVQQHVGMLTRLVNQLMSFRKIETGQMRLHRVPVNMQNYLKHVYDSFIPLAKHQKIQFNYQYEKTDCWVSIDTELYDQIVFNLLSNAFKFTSSNNRISLRLKAGSKPKTLEISVEDTGQGIDPEDKARLFDCCFQEKNERSNGQTGAGIGLALTKEIVELHGGSILLKSEEGKGTTFTVTQEEIEKPKNISEQAKYTGQSKDSDILGVDDFLKQNAMELQAIAKSQEEIDAQDAGGSDTEYPRYKEVNTPLPEVLIVEDNSELRERLEEYLSPFFNIHLAKNGKEGLSLAKTRHPHVIVTDVMMPVMDGIEMMSRIKEEEEISHIPILVLTAKSAIENQLSNFNTGADGYLEKPFNIQILRERITAMIQNREMLKKHFQEGLSFKPELVCKTHTDEAFLTKIVEIINVHMDDSDFTVETLAKEYGVPRIYLNKKIKALTNDTSTQFIRNVRLKQAAKLIAAGNLNINKVAWSVGYNDVSTFRSRFKTEFGMTPTAYKKEADKQ